MKTVKITKNLSLKDKDLCKKSCIKCQKKKKIETFLLYLLYQKTDRLCLLSDRDMKDLWFFGQK